MQRRGPLSPAGTLYQGRETIPQGLMTVTMVA